jgi:hypothetical protein
VQNRRYKVLVCCHSFLLWSDVVIHSVNHAVFFFVLKIRYTASATMSSVPDCRRPVALDKAKCIPGLMSILKRNDT